MGFSNLTVDDERLMALALRLGRRYSGVTAENPAVGCVIARHDDGGVHIVGRGATERGGRPHAERVALAEAGALAKGATAYVTLEPCSHWGKTPPCAMALIEAGIARVVCAHADPDSRVAGRGFAMLKEAGITVETGLLQKIAHRDLAGFLSRNVRKRPWLQVKMAFSQDGMIGKTGVGNFPVTGAMAKNRTYALRARADAILVGADTLLIDDPSLTVRLAGLEDRSPTRVVLDSKGRTPVDCQLVRTAKDSPVWIITSDLADQAHCEALEHAGCHIIKTQALPSGHLDLKNALEILASEGINTVFAECGAALSDALLKADLIDEFILYRGDTVVDHDGLIALGGMPEKCIAESGFSLEASVRMGKDRMLRYIRTRSLEELE